MNTSWNTVGSDIDQIARAARTWDRVKTRRPCIITQVLGQRSPGSE